MLGRIWANSYAVRPLLALVVISFLISFNKNLLHNCLVAFGEKQASYQAHRKSISLALINAGIHAYIDVSLRAQEMLVVWGAYLDTRRGIPTTHGEAYKLIEDVYILVECSLPGPLQNSFSTCPKPSRELISRLNSTAVSPLAVYLFLAVLLDLMRLIWWLAGIWGPFRHIPED